MLLKDLLKRRLMAEAGEGGSSGAGGEGGEAGTGSDAGTGEGGDAGTGEGSAEGEGEGAEGAGGEGGGSADTGDYADFNMPEGVNVDADLLGKFTPLMKDVELTQDQAQTFVTAMAEQVQAQQQGQIDAFSQQLEDWETASKSDQEFGGDKFDESAAIARSAIDAYGTPELKTLMNDYGIGNHPEIVRFMYKVGKTLKPDSPGRGGQASQKSEGTSEILYPSS